MKSSLINSSLQMLKTKYAVPKMLGITFLTLLMVEQRATAQSTIELEQCNGIQELIVEASSPRSGMNMFSLNGSPCSAAFRILWLAYARDDVATELKLTTEQREQLADLTEFSFEELDLYAFQDETKSRPDFYGFLTGDQIRRIELFGLRVDGGVALTRSWFAKELSLESEQVERIMTKLLVCRKEVAGPRARSTFAGPPHHPIANWDATKDSIQFNSWVFGQLTEQQEDKLEVLIDESKQLTALCDLYHKALAWPQGAQDK